MEELIYWRHHTPVGIKIEEITGGDTGNGKLWNELALQIYCENGKDGYREVGHYPSGAPFLAGSDERISISHTPGILVVATLRDQFPDANLSEFSSAAALGVDVEKADRAKARELRTKFLNEEEQKIVSADSVFENVLAWTIKEALYKAALTPGLDFRKNLIIEEMPECKEITPWLIAHSKGKGETETPRLGRGMIVFPDGSKEEMKIYSYLSEGFIITLVFSI